MDWDTKVLAWYQFPEPVGTIYTETELSDPQKVRTLFDYCQIVDTIISLEGWDYLLRTYGMEGLYRINEGSEWFADGGMEEFTQWVDHMRASSPPQLT